MDMENALAAASLSMVECVMVGARCCSPQALLRGAHDGGGWVPPLVAARAPPVQRSANLLAAYLVLAEVAAACSGLQAQAAAGGGGAQQDLSQVCSLACLPWCPWAWVGVLAGPAVNSLRLLLSELRLLAIHIRPSLPSPRLQLWATLEGGAQRLVLELVRRHWTLAELDCLPFGVALPLRQALHQCRNNPPGDWPREAYVLVGELRWPGLGALSRPWSFVWGGYCICLLTAHSQPAAGCRAQRHRRQHGRQRGARQAGGSGLSHCEHPAGQDGQDRLALQEAPLPAPPHHARHAARSAHAAGCRCAMQAACRILAGPTG